MADQPAAGDRLGLEHEHACGRVQELQQDQARADPDHVAVVQLGAHGALAVDEGAVATLEVVQHEHARVVGRLDARVPARHPGVPQRQGGPGFRVASDHQRLASERARVPDIAGGRAVDHEQAVQAARRDVTDGCRLCLREGHARGRSEPK